MRWIAALFLAFGLAACSGEEPAANGNDNGAGNGEKPTLYFSAIPDQNETELGEKFGELAKYLSGKLDVPVEYRAATDYGASVEMFKNGDIQLAWFGGLTGCQARAAVPGAKAIAQGKADPKYYSYFIAHKDTGLERSEEFPSEIAKLSFAFGSERSTSGRLMPEYFIRKNSGKTPKEFFEKDFIFSGSHPKTVQAVASGQVQAGAVNYKIYKQMVEKGDIDADTVRIIWKTPYYADYNWTAHPDLDSKFGEGFTKKVQDALIGITDPKLLSAFPREAMIPAKNEDFEGIAETAREIGLMR